MTAFFCLFRHTGEIPAGLVVPVNWVLVRWLCVPTDTRTRS